MTISVNELINEVGMTSTITLIICTVIIAILLIGIYFRRRAKKRGRPAGPLEAIQHVLTKTKEEKKMARVRKRKVHWDASNGLGVVGYKLYWAVGAAGRMGCWDENHCCYSAAENPAASP